MSDTRKDKGFTLLEILLVLVLVGLLGMFALPAYRQYVERGRLAQAAVDLTAINQAFKTVRLKQPAQSDSEWESRLQNITEARQSASQVDRHYRYETVWEADGGIRRYYLLVLPRAESSGQLSLWADAVGNIYRCTDEAAARKRLREFADGVGCEKL
ncbi:PilX family type IV pilin [Neisseria animalis]|uniref:PilX family type IV pilin n=1 Tax=Neisseria animalis TaxID=492 RepID=UPI000F6FF19D|nr:PilX family type IV pilin [Neisseria animalis]VEE06861.1 pilin [Neisseria animalis]